MSLDSNWSSDITVLNNNVFENIARSERSSHIPGGSHQRL